MEGVTISLYTNSACTTLYASAITGVDGYANFTITPTVIYYAKETSTLPGYELNPTVLTISKTGRTVGSTPDYNGPYVLTNIEYRTLILHKTDANGVKVEGAKFKISKNDGTAFLNYAGTSVSSIEVTTDSEGYASVKLPGLVAIGGASVTYKIDEVSVPGVTLSDADKANFKLINGTATFTFGSTESEKTIELKNPGKGHLVVTKQDDANVLLAGIGFTVAFSGFLTVDEANNATVPLAGHTYADIANWTTDASGVIDQNDLTAGWYRFTEVANPAYSTISPVYIKVTGLGIGQSGTTLVNSSKTIANTRKGYLQIAKTFIASTQYDGGVVPSSVKFDVYDAATGGNKVIATGITVPIVGNTGTSAAVLLDPGTYYLQEAGGNNWYAQYEVANPSDATLNASGWVTARIPVKVTSGNTIGLPVTLTVDNMPSKATVSIHKIDDATPAVAVPGTTFAIYYMNGTVKTYLLNSSNLPITAVTDNGGNAQITVTLPFARVMAGQNEYFLEEISAPSQYQLVTVPITLNPGDLIKGEGDAPMDVVDKTAMVVNLIKYGKTKANYDLNSEGALLSGATFDLYLVNETDNNAGTLVASKTTDASGVLTFGNLPKLTAGHQYYLYESSAPTSMVAGSLAMYVQGGDALIPPADVHVGSATYSMVPIGRDTNINLAGYNTPKGGLAILKYNYSYPMDPNAVPVGARFSIEKADSTSMGEVASHTYVAGDPTSLDDGHYTSNGTRFVDASGTLYNYGIMMNLDPGTYVVTEIEPAANFLKVTDSTSSDPWYTVRTVVVPDDGSIVTCEFANLPAENAAKPGIAKTVSSINGVSGASSMTTSLQGGDQTVTYSLSSIGSTDKQPL